MASGQIQSVMLLCRSLDTGGAERQLVVLAKALVARGVRVNVVVFYEGGAFKAELDAAGVAVHCLHKSGRWDVFGCAIRLWRLVRELEPDVMHGYLATPNLMLLALRPLLHGVGVAVVCGVRSALGSRAEYDNATRLSEVIHRRALRSADLVICNSQAGLDQVAPSSERSLRFRLIENGIDVGRYTYCQMRRRAGRLEWRVADDEVLFGLVARHDPVKNAGLFLEAAARVLPTLSRARFVLVGSEVPEVTDNLKRCAESLGLADRVIWAGHRADLDTVYSALDILCLSSDSEGFPNVVAEGMCVGLPCVCTDVGDVRRLVGEHGWVVPAGDPESFATAMADAAQRLDSWDRAKPRRWVQERFSVERLVDRTMDALNSVLLRKRP